MSSLTLPTGYHHLIHTQTVIGWDNLLRGFLSPEWHHLHLQYLQSISDDVSPPSTHPFLTALLSLIPDIQSMWKFRSSQRHSHLLTQQDTELLRQAKQQITSLYQLRSLILPTDRHIFQSSLQEHLRNNLSSLCSWLLEHAHYIHDSVKQTQLLHVSNTKQLSSFYPPLS